MGSIRFLSLLACFGLLSSAASAEEHRFKLESYVAYDKTSVVLGPAAGAKNLAKSQGLSLPKFVTFTPNTMPSAGVGLSFLGFGASADKSLPQTQHSVAERGKTTISRYEVHNNQSWYGVDVFRNVYQGFFQDSYSADAQFFQDSLFKYGQSFVIHQDMKLSIDGANAMLVLLPQYFSLNDALNQSTPRLKTGMSPLLMLSALRVTLTDTVPFVPADQQAYYGSDDLITGLSFTSIGLAPGLGMVLASEHLFFNPVGFCGLSVQHQVFTGIARDKPHMTGGFCDLRGSLGYTSGAFSAGFVGFKHIETVKASNLEISPTQSAVKLFVSARI